MPDFSSKIATENTEVDINAPTLLSVDDAKEKINISNELNQRSGFLLEDNPNAGVQGQLTTSNMTDVYFFSATESSKFMLARLNSENANYVAQLYMLDSEGNATPTNIYGFAGSLIQLNGLPVGDYAIIVFSNNDTFGSPYTFDINATNKAANLSKVIFLSSDLSIFMYETTDGDVCGNGKTVYNSKTNSGANLNWERIRKVNIEGGFEQRTHSVYSAKVKAMSLISTVHLTFIMQMDMNHSQLLTFIISLKFAGCWQEWRIL